MIKVYNKDEKLILKINEDGSVNIKAGEIIETKEDGIKISKSDSIIEHQRELKAVLKNALILLENSETKSTDESFVKYVFNTYTSLKSLLEGLLDYIDEKEEELVLNKIQVEDIENASKSFNSEQAKIDKLDITAKQARNKMLNAMLNSTKIKWQNNKNDIFATINDAIKKGESKVTFNNDDYNWMNFEKFIERVRYELNKRGYITHIYQESFDPTHGIDKNTFLNELKVSW